MSALESVAGAVRVSRFDHSSLSGFDSTAINTERFKMEYVVHFQGAARSGDLPLLTYGRMDDVNCGKDNKKLGKNMAPSILALKQWRILL